MSKLLYILVLTMTSTNVSSSWIDYLDNLAEGCLLSQSRLDFAKIRHGLTSCVQKGVQHCTTSTRLSYIYGYQVTTKRRRPTQYICGHLTPPFVHGQVHRMSYLLKVHKSLVIRITVLKFRLNYSHKCAKRTVQMTSWCSGKRHVYNYCGIKKPWHLNTGHYVADITFIYPGMANISFFAIYQIVNKQSLHCQVVSYKYEMTPRHGLLGIKWNITSVVLQPLSTNKHPTNELYFLQLRTHQYNILNLEIFESFVSSLQFYDGPGVKAPLLRAEQGRNNTFTIKTSAYQLFIISKISNHTWHSKYLYFTYRSELRTFEMIPGSNACRVHQNDQTGMMHYRADLPVQTHTTCAWWLIGEPGYVPNVFQLDLLNVQFTGNDDQHAMTEEECPNGGLFVFGPKFILYHDGCHVTDQYSLDIMSEIFFIFAVTFKGYSSLRFDATSIHKKCIVHSGICASYVGYSIRRYLDDEIIYRMGESNCLFLIDQLAYSHNHRRENRCRFHFAALYKATVSVSLEVRYINPSQQNVFCSVDASCSPRFIDLDIHSSSNWPTSVGDQVTTTRYTSGRISPYRLNIESLDSVYVRMVNYDVGNSQYNDAFLTIKMVTPNLCSINGQPTQKWHFLIKPLLLAKPDIKSCFNSFDVPNELTTFHYSFQHVQDEWLTQRYTRYVFGRRRSVENRTNPTYTNDATDWLLPVFKVNISYSNCSRACTQDRVYITEENHMLGVRSHFIWTPRRNWLLWQNLFTASGFRLSVERNLSAHPDCKVQDLCQPTISLYLNKERDGLNPRYFKKYAKSLELGQTFTRYPKGNIWLLPMKYVFKLTR